VADVGVRLARAADAPAVADVQLRTWETVYTPIVPAAVLAAVREIDAEARWRDAITDPPSPRHRVLVATEADRLVGLAAYAPAADDDVDVATTGEITTLLIEPDASRRGHGSRLLAAAVEHLRDDGFTHAVVWLFDADAVARAFYESAGWAADGARRELDMGRLVPEVRLHTDLRP
jgi:GNAT superfamily N-acetyltransferase